MRTDLAAWVWRAATLGALLWIGYNLHRIERQMPSGIDYSTEQAIQGIEKDTEAIRDALSGRRSSSASPQGWEAFGQALPAPPAASK